mmetsp:Transcript_5513/g.11393  ORF Transcript_5513/g.11393 Transcript_5513/m.11393 type:complete len:464 (+) Transcript_5513:1-1392(+)
MDISNQHQQKEAPLLTAQGKNVSAAVVDTSGLPKPLVAAHVDDDAQSLVIAAPAALIDNHQLRASSSSTNTLSPSSARHNSNNINVPAQIPVVEDNVASNSKIVSVGSVSGKSETRVMNVDSDGVNEVMDNAKSNGVGNEGGEEDNMSDESEYEYEDDDDAAFSGFLVSSHSYETTSRANSNTASSSSAPARIEEESVSAPSSAVASASATSAAVDADEEAPRRKKWREPSRAAVSMSLRAQQETSGSKRRLAQDLYRIMNQDTEEAGFSLAPQSEDSMEKWTIKLFQFDPDSNLAKDMLVVGIDHIELEMKFPEQYPFEPPFVRVSKPRFKRQTGFVMNGALCMELLTKDGWNPINDIESVIVSIRSLLVVGDGRLQASSELTKAHYEQLLVTAQQEKKNGDGTLEPEAKKARTISDGKKSSFPKSQVGSYTATEAQSAYSHLSDYHKKKGWDTSGWWARKG